MNFYFIPFAGGSEISYNPLVNILSSKGHNCYQCSLPGRGRRFKEDFLKTVPEMAQDIFLQIKDKLIENNYVLFGHSMGALLTTHVLALIKEHNAPMPQYVFLSGRGGEIKRPSPPYKSEMDSATFRSELKKMGGIPDEVFNEESIMSFFEPIIKADFKAIESYEPIDVTLYGLKVMVYYGRDDDFSLEQVACWQRISTQKISCKAFDGGHFFVLDEREAIIEDMLLQINSRVLLK